ncbi:3-Oxoacyl-(acyl-carrier protein) reductase [Elusimicrobium minutum Pei191]|uniref:3-oxoacyl-[acyl-carrier-protein] reductase n=1 Tax=Elusimicrobium minutum (strain Pei191) TaxID=445932 RepID=B2KC87_ELUMP|nr:3-oxoacyl-[acyl-carrier-protein] reductase [Elusimicrobium minutum]ACC98214.1 3-Oxoacyl-(acyl-carrier protein) reductase [Elusimicrobium minutum Pei191]
MKNKNVIITGGSRGIGFGAAKAFAEKGANLAICATNEAGLAKAKTELEHLGVKIYTETVNVSDVEACQKFVDNAVKTLGGVDVLVNNAGITKDNLAVRLNESDWDAVLDINLKGSFFMSKAVLKYMMKARAGSIINLTSIVGQAGNAGQVNYAASKAGLIGITKTLAKEFASRNIRVNAVAPGFVQTEMTDATFNEEVKQAMLEQVPLKRFASVGDIAKAILFLASEDASYITGQILAVNGGLYI